MEQQNIVWSVSEVNRTVKELLENSLMPFYMRGEIGSLLVHRSGHVYLTLKDEKSQIKAAFFGGAATWRNLDLKNGEIVEVFGRLSVYDVRGEYQFSIKKVSRAGAGDLQKKFEEIKQKLASEGLFDSNRKKSLPKFPEKIGVVTSPSGAAIRDFLQVVNRRFPNLNVKIYPAQVQGEGSEKELIRGIEFFNRTNEVEVVVLTRGGGSMEDLWSFNSEELARAIAKSKIPIISAIGHEIDFTIADFVADLRASTPSVAAELVANSKLELEEKINRLTKDMKNHLNLTLANWQTKFQRLENSKIFSETYYLIENQIRKLDDLSTNMNSIIDNFINLNNNKLELFKLRVASVNPALQLERGYVMLFDEETSKLIKSKDIPVGSKIKAKMSDGELKLTVRD